jgi:MFS family permease
MLSLRQSHALRALHHRNYRLYFTGQIFAQVGSWMQMIAQQWLVYRLTGSIAMLGLINALGLLPLIPLMFWGGSLADRLPRRRILIFTQVAMSLQSLLLAVLTWTGAVQVWHVLALSVLLAALMALNMPAQQAFVVEMVEGKEDLTSAIGLNSALLNGARALGPVLAGIGVATTGEAGAFLANGLSILAVVAALLAMRVDDRPPAQPRGSAAAHMLEGMRYLGRHQVLLVLTSMVGVSAFLSMPYSTLLPVFAKVVLADSARPLVNWICPPAAAAACQSPDAVTYGFLMAVVGVGALVGALTVAGLPHDAPRGRWLTAGNVGFPILLLGMAVSRSVWLTAALLAGVGFCFVAQNALVNTLLQFAAPDALRGRIMSFYVLTFSVTMRLGAMQGGLMGEAFGAPSAIGVGAFLSLIYGIFVAWRYPSVRELK